MIVFTLGEFLIFAQATLGGPCQGGVLKHECLHVHAGCHPLFKTGIVGETASARSAWCITNCIHSTSPSSAKQASIITQSRRSITEFTFLSKRKTLGGMSKACRSLNLVIQTSLFPTAPLCIPLTLRHLNNTRLKTQLQSPQFLSINRHSLFASNLNATYALEPTDS
jgi:hypothetical protein